MEAPRRDEDLIRDVEDLRVRLLALDAADVGFRDQMALELSSLLAALQTSKRDLDNVGEAPA